jgi:hypothetical protein
MQKSIRAFPMLEKEFVDFGHGKVEKIDREKSVVKIPPAIFYIVVKSHRASCPHLFLVADFFQKSYSTKSSFPSCGAS